MDVFKLAGTIAINASGALKAIGDTSASASALTKTFEKVGSAALAVGKVAATGFAAASAGVGLLMKKSVQSYAEYEQLMGGTELLFGKGSDYIIEKSKNAFSTVQRSQSDYLNTVNGYAVGLKKALKGSEEEAAILADRIVTAQADVIAATGYEQERVSNAFDGLMREEYSMLDNLGLGITATKTGFKQLIKEVNNYNKAQGKATKYDIRNAADRQKALLDYIEMQGLAGYAAMESAEPIAGRWASASAAWDNLLVGMADGTQDMDFLIDNFATSATNVITNVAKILPNIAKGLSKVIEGLIPELPGMVETLLPSVIEGAVSVVSGLVSVMPKLLSTLGKTLADTWKFKVWRGIQKFFKINFGISLPSWGMVVHELKEWCNTVLNEAGTAIDTVRSKFESATTFLSETFAPVFEKIAPIIASAKEALQPLGEKFAEVKDKIATFIGKAVEYVENGSAAKDATDLLKSAFQWLANAVIAVIDGVSAFATWCKENQTTITILTVIISSFAIAWALVNGAVKLWSVISAAAATGTSLLSAAIGALTSPVTLTVLAIGTLIAAVALCIIYWDKITAAIDSAALELAAFFGIEVPADWSLCQSIGAAFDWVAEKVSAVIGMVKELLRWLGLVEEASPSKQPTTISQAEANGMSQQQIHMGLASGKIIGNRTGGFGGGSSDGNGAGASFAEGGVFSKPTFFNTRLGKTLVGEGGEAEAVAPISVLQGYVASAVASQTVGMAGTLNLILEAITNMDANMGGHMRDALEDTSLKVNNREFARMVKAVG